MEIQTEIKIDWREKLRIEWVRNGAGAMLDMASKRINELESDLKESKEVARQAVNLYEQSK